MPHKHTLETDKHVNNGCIKYDEKTDECEDKTSFHVALEVLKNDYKTKIKKDAEKIFLLKENLKDLKTSVKNTDEKLGGGNPDNPDNPDNTILDDENKIKEIIEQFTYLTKTPDFITKIKDFLEKKNIFKTDLDSEPESELESEAQQDLEKKTEELEAELKKLEADFIKKEELEAKEKEEKLELEAEVKEAKADFIEKKKELEAKVKEAKAKVIEAEKKILKKRKAEKEKKATNNSFEIKIIDKYDMFISESKSDKLKKNYYFNIDYYDSQPKFQEFKTHFNQLKELKKEYQDLISIFESAITEFRKKKTNLEKLINTYFKNSLSTKRETLNKFDDFIKNITKNVNNIKDIPKDLIDFLQVKKSRIQTSLIQKSFPRFESLDKIEFSKLNIDDVHSPDSDTETVKIEKHEKTLKIISIKDDNNKTFTLKFTKKEKSSDTYIYTYMMKNSENSNYNHELYVILNNKEVSVDNTYKIENIQAKLDTDIKISDEKRGGAPPAGSPSGDNSASNQLSITSNLVQDQSPEIKGLKGVFNNLQKKIEYVIKQKIRDGVDVSGVKSKDIEKGDVGDDIIETLVLDYERKKQNVKSMDEKERIDREFLEKVNGLGLNLNEIFEVNLMDKFYFILYSLVLHIITYSIIESLIMSSNLNSLVSIMGIYSFLYVLLIILTLGIIHIYGYRGKVFLNYLNLDHNFYNIIGHFIIVAIFFSIILILSQYINTANIENEDERVKMLYRIEIITGVMFTFTTMFILIL